MWEAEGQSIVIISDLQAKALLKGAVLLVLWFTHAFLHCVNFQLILQLLNHGGRIYGSSTFS